jgi:DNA-binding NtrC family response regulator
MTRILVLDDDAAVLNCFLVVLAQAQRFEVEVLSDSARAFDVIAGGNFDVILLDMDMPHVSGMEVLRHVRARHPAIEVIVITGVGDVELAVEAMKLGAYDYLSKPVESRRLVACIEEALERRDGGQDRRAPPRATRPPPASVAEPRPHAPVVPARPQSWHRWT